MSQQSSASNVASTTTTAASATTSADNFFQSITSSSTTKSQSQTPSSSHEQEQEQAATEIYRAGRRNRWNQHTASSASPSLNEHELGVDNVENFFHHHQQHQSSHQPPHMNSNPHVNRALSTPWLWYHRPVDTRHLPTPRPLPPIYSDVHRLRSASIELQRPWQRYTHVFTIGLCSILVPYMLLYMPIQEDDFMLPFRRWVFGDDYKATNVKANNMKT